MLQKLKKKKIPIQTVTLGYEVDKPQSLRFGRRAIYSLSIKKKKKG